MSREETLLGRIASGRGRGRVRAEASRVENVDALMESVRRHVNRLLNARHGMSEAAPDYGLPALTDMSVGQEGYIRAIQEALRSTIDKYEPRLKRIRVSHVVDDTAPDRLVFRVDAVLVGKSGEHRVWYETAIKATGQFDVAG